MSKTTPIEALTVHAKQADPDGMLVAVSREAVDWAIAHIKKLESALRPFAEAHDAGNPAQEITLGDLHAAKKALDQGEQR